MSDRTAAAGRRRSRHWLAAIGPGLVVMLADMDASSVITVAQSGAQWGYRLLLLQVLLIPLMVMTQELTVRLGLATGKGYCELVRQHYGRGVAALVTLVLLLSCFGTLVAEMSGLVGAGTLFHVPPHETLGLLVAGILAMVLSGSYQSVERAVAAIGLFTLAFAAMAFNAHVDGQQLAAEVWQFPLADRQYLYLVAANIGTTIMPWMIFYQQSALVGKGVDLRQLRVARVDTITGAALCQALTVALLVASVATLYPHHQQYGLDNIRQIGDAFGALLGPVWGKALFAIGLCGGALVAATVVCLTVAWALGEAVGVRHSLERRPLAAPWFYGPFAVLLLAAALLVGSGINLVQLSLAVAVANALLLPLLLLLLYLLARRALPKPLRLRGPYAVLVAAAFALITVLGLFAGVAGALP